MTIVEFLSARLGEDERAAHAAPSATGGPGRARADVNAKRRIVRCYVNAYRAGMSTLAHGDRTPESSDAWAALHAWRRALEHLAEVDAAHPDFDPSWKT